MSTYSFSNAGNFDTNSKHIHFSADVKRAPDMRERVVAWYVASNNKPNGTDRVGIPQGSRNFQFSKGASIEKCISRRPRVHFARKTNEGLTKASDGSLYPRGPRSTVAIPHDATEILQGLPDCYEFLFRHRLAGSREVWYPYSPRRHLCEIFAISEEQFLAMRPDLDENLNFARNISQRICDHFFELFGLRRRSRLAPTLRPNNGSRQIIS